MKVVKRLEIKAPYGSCTECGSRTRSHVMEYPEYEEFEEQIFRDLEEYQAAKKGEDPEEDAEYAIRYRRLNEPEVMCHRCWVPQREKATNFLQKKMDVWKTDPLTNMPKIRKFLKDWDYMGFNEEEHYYGVLLVQEIKKIAKDAVIGSEEE